MARYPASLLRSVQKPICYVGGEYHIIRKDPAAVTTRVALIFPDSYEIGMSHLGSRILYHAVNGMAGVAAERFFSPWPDLEQKLRQTGLPLLSLENGLPLGDFHVLAFSLLYEMSFTNILTILDAGKIPFRTADRGLDIPLVIAGGPAASNPEPVADFFDLIVSGEGEESLPALVVRAGQLRPEMERFASRQEYLAEFLDLPGVYVPSLYQTTAAGSWQVAGEEMARKRQLPFPVRRCWVPDLDLQPLPVRLLVPNTEIVHDRVTAEISRGCLQGCRFCHASVFYRPVRERKAGELYDWILAAVADTGYEEVSLASLSTGDYTGIEDLAEILARRLQPDRVSLSFPSLRVSELSARLARSAAEVRKTGFTVAPEAGTQRLRDVINKNLDTGEIVDGVLAAFRAGWDLIKLYFMIGLPFETDEDVHGIAELVRQILARLREEPDYQTRRRKFLINVSVSPFIPKAHTPFQWAAMNTVPELRRKIWLLKDQLRMPAVRIKWHEPEISRLEAILSRGDRSCSALIEAAWRLGARFDGWGELFNPAFWETAIQQTGLNPDEYLSEVEPGRPFPWSHLNMGVEEAFLLREWQQAREGRSRGACGLVPAAEEEREQFRCHACGLNCRPASAIQRHQQNREALEQLQRLRAEEKPARSPFLPYRIAYSRQETAVWMSHLDMIRTLQRIMRRSGLPVQYTEGFHPRPDMGFSPALGVGVGSRREYLDVKLAGSPGQAPAWLEALNRVSVPGIAFIDLQLLPEQSPSISSWTGRASYRLWLPRDGAGEYQRQAESVAGTGLPLFRHWLESRIAGLLSQSSISMPKKKKDGSVSMRDLRPFLLEAGVEESGDGYVLNLLVRLTNSGTMRVEQWLDLCLPGYAGDFTAERTGLWPEDKP